MARLPLRARRGRRSAIFFNLTTSIMLVYYYVWFMLALAYRRKCWQIERRIKIRELREERLYQLIGESDAACISQLRMDRRTFHILCEMVRDVGGLKATRNTSLEEIVSSFLYVLSHHFCMYYHIIFVCIITSFQEFITSISTSIERTHFLTLLIHLYSVTGVDTWRAVGTHRWSLDHLYLYEESCWRILSQPARRRRVLSSLVGEVGEKAKRELNPVVEQVVAQKRSGRLIEATHHHP